MSDARLPSAEEKAALTRQGVNEYVANVYPDAEIRPLYTPGFSPSSGPVSMLFLMDQDRRRKVLDRMRDHDRARMLSTSSAEIEKDMVLMRRAGLGGSQAYALADECRFLCIERERGKYQGASPEAG